MEDILIRYEKGNIIIWSNKKMAYFVAKNKEDNKEVDKVLKGEITKGKIYDELNNIGAVKGKKRVLYSKVDNDLMAPLEYYFDFTNLCNLQCTHCYNRENMNTNTLTQEQIISVIDDMYLSGVMRLHLAGGEPTLFPKELDVYMATAKKYGIVTSMATNGVAITDEICEILTKNDVMSITISIESSKEEENAKIRGKGSLGKALDGIRKLAKYKRIHNSKYFIGIKVSYDVDIDEDEFEGLIKLAKEYDIDILKFANPERCVFHEKRYYSKKAEKYYKNMLKIRILKEKYDKDLIITQIASPVNGCSDLGIPGFRGCIGAQELIAINCRGEITPCLMNMTPLGNIFEYGSIQKLYGSKLIKDYYKKIKDYDCSTCQYHSKCRGGCQVRKIVEYGEIKNIDPLCPIKNNQSIPKIRNDEDKLMKICVLHSL